MKSFNKFLSLPVDFPVDANAKKEGKPSPIYLFRLNDGDTRIRSADQMPLIASGGQAYLPPTQRGKSLERQLNEARNEKLGAM